MAETGPDTTVYDQLDEMLAANTGCLVRNLIDFGEAHGGIPRDAIVVRQRCADCVARVGVLRQQISVHTGECAQPPVPQQQQALVAPQQ